MHDSLFSGFKKYIDNNRGKWEANFLSSCKTPEPEKIDKPSEELPKVDLITRARQRSDQRNFGRNSVIRHWTSSVGEEAEARARIPAVDDAPVRKEIIHKPSALLRMY